MKDPDEVLDNQKTGGIVRRGFLKLGAASAPAAAGLAAPSYDKGSLAPSSNGRGRLSAGEEPHLRMEAGPKQELRLEGRCQPG